MLLQLENTSTEHLEMLLNFAKENKMKLKLVDKGGNNYFLPGKPLSHEELLALIEKSRKSGSVFIEEAHLSIRNALNAD